VKSLFVGARIRHLREDRGLSQAQLARMLELSPSYLNQIERDHRPLTVPVLLRLTETFGVDPTFFSAEDTARLIAELREALLDDAVGLRASAGEVSELATNHPDIARALINLRRRYRDTVEQTAALIGGQGGATDGGPVTAMPHEIVRDFFYDRHNYFAELDEAAEALALDVGAFPGDARVAFARRLRDRHDIRVVQQNPDDSRAEIRRYDPAAKVLRLATQLRPGQQAFQLATQLALLEHGDTLDTLASSDPRLEEPQTRRLARIGLAHYFAGAALMPYEAFHEAAEEYRYDIERLGDTFRVGYEVVCHRLSTLQRPKLRGVPFSFVRVDRAGNMSKRQSATGFHFSRGGGTCPLWNVYEAFTTPGQILRQIAQMPDGRSYFWIARTVARKPVGFGAPAKVFALGLGCELRHASRLVYANGLDLGDDAQFTPIGMGCKSCERVACPQRAFPAVDRQLDVDENRTTFAAYPAVREADPAAEAPR
jgi:XRE family transcriptional regulator, fatty acid utilization regulator